MSDKINTTEEIIENYRKARKEVRNLNSANKKLKSELNYVKEVLESMKYYRLDYNEEYSDAFVTMKFRAEDALRYLEKGNK